MQTETATQFSNLDSCASNAPEGTYESAKNIRTLIGCTVDKLIADLNGLGLKADRGDLAWQLESEIYRYIKNSNPNSCEFAVSEGFGEAMSLPIRDRVIASAEANRDFLRGAA